MQSPVCVPSRFAFLTGRYCSSTGVGSNGPEFPSDLTPVNQLLSPYGYHGAQIGKLHFVPHSNRDHRDPVPSYGFDTCIVSDEPGCYDDAYARWVERVAPEQFTSDHGEYLGDHGRMQKGMPHSVITNVPCIVRLPGDPRAGEAVTEVVEQIDLTATVLDYCGVQVPRFVQGCSLRPLLDGSGTWHKSSALTEAFSEYGAAGSVTLQTDRYLYGCDTRGRELLYDKQEDPAELCDVAAEERYAAVRDQLGVRLQQARFSARPRVARY